MSPVASQGAFYLNNTIHDKSVFSVQLPTAVGQALNGFLDADRTTVLSLWIRPSRLGNFAFKFLFIYQSLVNDSSSYRIARYTINMQVEPSIKMSIMLHSSKSDINEFLVSVELDNITKESGILINRVTSYSPSWKMVSLSEK